MALSRLPQLLPELRAELQVRDNPERQARTKLKPNVWGWTEKIYADEAFQIWEDLRSKFPDDLNTIHHLAIMHHARAFDLEQSDDPNRADSDWKRSLELWHYLWKTDLFWEDLAERIDHDMPNPFPQVRDALPEQILQIHFDIAFDVYSKNYRARQHIRLGMDSPFSKETKHRVRLRSYERITGHLPPAVWESTTFDLRSLEPALEAISSYLDLDEEFQPALIDLLGLLTKLQTGYVQQANIVGDAEKFQALLQQVRTLGIKYEPYITRLEQHLQQLESDVLYDLTLWHSRIGQALCRLEDYEAAAAHYSRARLAVEQDKDEACQEKMREEWLLCVVLAARNHATGDETGEMKARGLLKSIAGEGGLPPICLMLRANTYMLLKEFDVAERDGKESLALLRQEREGIDRETAARMETQCRELLDAIIRARRQHAVRQELEKAQQALKVPDGKSARRALDKAITIDPENVLAFYLRSQCFLKQAEVEKARADFDRANTLAQAEGNQNALDALRRLGKDLNEIQQRVDLYGGSAAFHLQQQAAEAFNGGQYKKAAELLRQALKLARPAGRSKLEQDLRACLRKQVEGVLRQAGQRAEARDFSGARDLCGQALSISPDDFSALFLRAQCHVALDDNDAATSDLNRAEASAKRDGERRALEAVADLRRQLQQIQQRKQEEDIFQRAVARATIQDFSGARRFCDQVLINHPDHFSALYLRAQCYMAERDFDEAEEDLDRAQTIARASGNQKAMEAVDHLRAIIRMMRGY